MRRRSFPLFVLVALSPHVGRTQQASTLELQAIQSREFESSLKVAFTAVLSVFQDLAYNINSASLETGLVTAKSPAYNEFEFLVRYTKDERATAFVEPVGQGRVKIRLSIVRSRRALGRGEEETPVTDPNVYQTAFAKIQNAIFIRKNLAAD